MECVIAHEMTHVQTGFGGTTSENHHPVFDRLHGCYEQNQNTSKVIKILRSQHRQPGIEGFGWTFVVAVICMSCSGHHVDYGRSKLYQVRCMPSATQTGTSDLTQQSEEVALSAIIRPVLKAEGFRESPRSPHLWQKHLAMVEVYTSKAGELILEARAFGGTNDVRVSEDIEGKLLRVLQNHPELEVTEKPIVPLIPQGLH